MKADWKEARVEGIFSWIQENSDLISALASVATVAIWLLYLQLFYAEFRRRRNLLVFIHQTSGLGSESTCMIVNLSAHPVHILGVAAEFQLDGDSYLQCVSRYDRQPENLGERRGVIEVMDQGPLKSGELLSIGTLDGLLDYALERGGLAEQARLEPGGGREAHRDRLEAITIHVAVMHPGYGGQPLGASRRFTVHRAPEGRRYLADSIQTSQVRPPGGRRLIERWLDACMETRTLPLQPGESGFTIIKQLF